jgi:hypothetical protein
MQTVEICTKNLKLRGKYRTITIKPNQNPTHKNLSRGNLDITYYTVPLLPVCKKTRAPTKIRNNKEEHIRSTWSSLYLISLLSKGTYADEILEYGWYIGFVTHVI